MCGCNHRHGGGGFSVFEAGILAGLFLLATVSVGVVLMSVPQ